MLLLLAAAMASSLADLVVPDPAGWRSEYDAADDQWVISWDGDFSPASTHIEIRTLTDAPPVEERIVGTLQHYAPFLDPGKVWVRVRSRPLGDGFVFVGRQREIWGTETSPAVAVVRRVDGIWITCHADPLVRRSQTRRVISLCTQVFKERPDEAAGDAVASTERQYPWDPVQ